MSERLIARIPYFLNQPMALVWFESDEVIIGLLGLYLGILSGGFMWFIGLFGFLYYRHIKKKSSRGLLRHLPHILGFKTFKGFPHAFVTEFME